MKNKIIFIFSVVLIAIALVLLENHDCSTNQESTVKLCTNYGDIVFQLYDQDAPKTVANFIALVNKDFYDGLIFHRVVNNFMIQGGDPFCTNNQGVCGAGGPGFAFDDELDPDTPSAKQGYVRGVVAMANSGPNTNGSQFFIVQQDTFLPHKYNIFGKVISGQEVVDKIAAVKVDDRDQPLKSVVINDVAVKK